MMSKLVFIILVNFSISTHIVLGENICSHYDDQDCVHPNVIKNGHFVNQWAVYLPGLTKEQARRLLEDIGFDYLGKVMDGIDLHLVTKMDIPEKHAMPNKKVIDFLKKHEKVYSVAQKHVILNSPDEVYNILDEKRVYCQSLNPDQIKLNDGRKNLERIMNRVIKVEEDVESHAIKPITSNPILLSNTEKTGDNNNHKTKSKLAHQNLMEMDLSDENLTIEDFSFEMVPTDYPSGVTSSSSEYEP